MSRSMHVTVTWANDLSLWAYSLGATVVEKVEYLPTGTGWLANGWIVER